MCNSKDGRTTTDRKYRPIRREASRYGKIEKALNDIKDEGQIRFEPQTVAKRIKILGTMQVKSIFRFTKGIDKDPEAKGWYIFTGEPIRVDAG